MGRGGEPGSQAAERGDGMEPGMGWSQPGARPGLDASTLGHAGRPPGGQARQGSHAYDSVFALCCFAFVD